MKVGKMRYTLSLLVLAGVFLGGCGQKGDLYLPQADEEKEEQAE